jgi:Sensors of blue-light using FAD
MAGDVASLYSLVYLSDAAVSVTSEVIDAILAAAREFNERNDITGLLLFRRGTFMQCLEGNRDVVLELYGRIRKDSRHSNVTTLGEMGIVRRIFPDWSMAFEQAGSTESRRGPTYEEVLTALGTPGSDTDSQALLRSFLHGD